MVSSMKSVLIVAVVASLACTAYAISCYQCESSFDAKCGEKFDPEGINKADCSRVPIPRFLQNLLPIKNATGCMKTVNEVNGLRHTIRTCYFGDVQNTHTGCQSDPSLPYVKQVSCDVCTDNLCNSSTSAGPIAVTLVLFVAMARVLQ